MPNDEKFLEVIEVYDQLPRDKKLHLVFCLAISAFSGYFLGYLTGFFIANVIGAAKELIWDFLLKRGHPSWGDMIANWVGMTIGSVILAIGGFPPVAQFIIDWIYK